MRAVLPSVAPVSRSIRGEGKPSEEEVRPGRGPLEVVAAYDDDVSAAPGPAAPVPLRAARGAAVAAVGLLVAAAGHGAAGGSTAPGALGVPVALLVVAACVVASARSWTPLRLVVALSGVQVVVHGALLLGTPSAQADPRLAGVASASAAHAHDHATSLAPGMVLAHLAAVVLAAVVLARVDVAVTVLWHLARRLLLPSAVAALRLPGPVVVPVEALLRPARSVAHGCVATLRGPPAPLGSA